MKGAARLNVWRAVMAVFAMIWVLVALIALFSWSPLFFPLALAAGGNACAAILGFDRYGNLIVALAVISSLADLILVLGVAFILFAVYAFATLDWSGLGGVH